MPPPFAPSRRMSPFEPCSLPNRRAPPRGSFPHYAVSTGACDESGTRFVAKPVLKRQLVVAQHNSGWRSEVATRVCIVRRCMPVAVANVPLHTVLYHAAGQFATRSNTAIRLSAATAVCVRGKDESTPVERHKKARLARYRPLRVTTCHPQLDLCPLRACTLRARGTQGVLSLSPMRTVSVSFRQALAQWRNARRHMWAGACRAHSLGPRNRLPSSTTHTRAVLLGPPPSVKRRRSQPPSSRMLGTATVLRGLWQVAVTGSRCGTPSCSRKQASKPRRPACCRQHT